jgi:glutamate synthase (NADPH) large chain
MSHGTFAEGRSVDAGRPEGTPRPRAGLVQFAPGSAECGVALVAHLSGVPSHETLDRALGALDRLEHRGGEGADVDTGDGAGILLQIPDALLRAVVDFALPPLGQYGVAVCFLPADDDRRRGLEALLERVVAEEGQHVLGWRDVPTDQTHAGRAALDCVPAFRQLFIGAGEGFEGDTFDRKLFVIRHVAARRSDNVLGIMSCSSRTLVYKGMLKAPQLRGFYPDLDDERCRSAIGLVHSRFSTNTSPSWELAQPYRMLCHNGEVNTLAGNRNWMRAREPQLRSELLGDDMAKLLPVLRDDVSDSASLDAVLELLVRSGRPVPEAVMMMLPEAYERRDDLSQSLRDFFTYSAGLMEPWDGPVLIAFSDGRLCGASLDRNGLRPGRWVVTKDGWVVLASEAGTLHVDSSQVDRKGRLLPGKLFVVDVEKGTVSADGETENRIAETMPFGEWAGQRDLRLEDLPEGSPVAGSDESLERRQILFGYSQEDLVEIAVPMVSDAKEPNGSMGNDTPLAVLSDHRPPLFDYFIQRFAQVTNPAIDPVRESIVMSLESRLGPRPNLLDRGHGAGGSGAGGPGDGKQVVLDQPVLLDADLARLRELGGTGDLRHCTLDATWPVTEGAAGMLTAVERLRSEAVSAVRDGCGLLVLSDRAAGRDRSPVPSLLATASVHHHLVREGERLSAGLVVETGEVREVHHVAGLLGYGASAVNPYLMIESIDDLLARGEAGDTPAAEAGERLIEALGAGLLKILSRMGISTIASYTGAQIFEVVGLDPDFVAEHFGATPSRVGGIGAEILAEETLARHALAYPEVERPGLPVGGRYRWDREGEFHMWNPDTIPLLQQSVGLTTMSSRSTPSTTTAATPDDRQRQQYRAFTAAAEHATRRSALRGLLRLRPAETPLPIEQVEPATSIVQRFATGAMSLGSLSPEAHETLAVAMNRINGRSNTGEGGEDPRRYASVAPDEDNPRSAIKQVASGRFGVTTQYLVNADELQIKVAQGSKPGEGGQLPGHKVTEYIARLRYSTPGVGLISPPPHHDIYSIEDLKQLIFDLRCANDTARVSVKLVSEVGVGTVAAGCVKANADRVTIAGTEGGTGSSPLSSIKHAGVPWELGLAETQQMLVSSGLRSRISLEVDGQMKTGRDVVIAGLLGADEMTFSTAPLIATGCIMMRVCHLNTCPVGIATQDETLRERFQGTPDHVVTYFFHVAEEVRELMSCLGVATFDELIGRVDLLEADPGVQHWKGRTLDLSHLLAEPDDSRGIAGGEVESVRHRAQKQRRVILESDYDLVRACATTLETGEPIRLERELVNSQRAVGGLLSSAIARRYGEDGLPEATITATFTGSAGQSFGAWLAHGVDFTLFGEANDYVGKGLSGGVVTIRPAEHAAYKDRRTVLMGNTVLYGATSGRAFFRGLAGERFAVRNSGAHAVVEGVGDHGCEYMTGGRVVVLGPTGYNFAAGMSGGIAYVLDREGTFPNRCNRDLVNLEAITNPDEVDEVRGLLAEHQRRTGSPVAAELLEDWDTAVKTLVRVMPKDYEKVLRQRAETEHAEVQGNPSADIRVEAAFAGPETAASPEDFEATVGMSLHQAAERAPREQVGA